MRYCLCLCAFIECETNEVCPKPAELYPKQNISLGGLVCLYERNGINKVVNFDLLIGGVYMGLARLVKRYSVVVLFPTISFGSIFADWNHTRKWKLEKAALGGTESSSGGNKLAQ